MNIDNIRKAAEHISTGMSMHGPDSVMLTDREIVREGLSEMLTAAIGEHGYSLGHVDVQLALLVIEAAKRAPDLDEWFPRGKWATIQAMQNRTDHQLNKMFQGIGGRP